MRLLGRFLLPWEGNKNMRRRVHVRYRNGSRVRRKSTRKRKRREQRDWAAEVQRELARDRLAEKEGEGSA